MNAPPSASGLDPGVSSRPLTCAITGTGGYLGSCMKARFESQGWQVMELTRQPKAGARAAAFHLGTDVRPEALAGVAALVHCAYDFKPLRWAEIHAVNVEGTRKLLESARAAGVRKIVCISSVSAFDGCRSLYGKAKLEIERLGREHGALLLRPGLIYSDQPRAMFGSLVAQVERASVLPLFGGGSQIQFLVHQEDLCAFVHRFAGGHVATVDRPLTAAHEQGWTFREILEAIARARNKRLKFIAVPWRLLWAGLKTAELCRVPVGFRSDSLVSLMYQNPRPDFSPNVTLGLACRPFQIEKLRLQPV